MTPAMIEHLISMQHSPVHNYVIPGLTSWMLGEPSKTHGCVRMFTMSRTHEESIVPHSHRFDFRCLVLKGSVKNVIWTEEQTVSYGEALTGDQYEVSEVTYEGEFGVHKCKPCYRAFFNRKIETYTENKEYSMKAEEIHSIYFSKGARVLFFEGPPRLPTSVVIEPVVDGEKIPLMRTDPWMFRKG